MPWKADHLKEGLKADDAKLPDLNGVIAWGHDMKDIVVMDGNRRVLQWQLNGSKPIEATMLIGTSPNFNRWFVEPDGHSPALLLEPGCTDEYF